MNHIKSISIKKNQSHYYIKFNQLGLDEDHYDLIKGTVKDAIERELDLTLDLTSLDYVNVDFLARIINEYNNYWPKEIALEKIQDKVTLEVIEGSKVDLSSKVGTPGTKQPTLFNYKFKRREKLFV